MTENSTPICSRCGTSIPSDAASGLCPRCLMAMNFESRTVPEGEVPCHVPPIPPEELAEKFPQFEMLECLGRGGMGVVYKARQKSLNRIVAIKILPPERVGEAKFSDRFAVEAATLAKLSHPNIVTVHDFGETGGLFYIVMEYVDGVNLRDLMCDGKLEAKQALAIVPPICEALQYAHDKGIVHRDIKPENLLLDRDGRIKIADFGIASLIGASGENIGTPPYMAPEQSGRVPEVDHRADIYALGVVLYEMLTGERPARDLVAPSKKVSIDVRLDEMVLRALDKSPELRYQTANEFRTVVETMGKPAVVPEVPPSVEEKRKKRRKKVIFRFAEGSPSRAALLMIALVCVLGGLFVILAGEPLWDLLTSDQVRNIPVEAELTLQRPSTNLTPVILGTLAVGGAMVIAVFVFALNMVSKSTGSGAGKGFAVGCLSLVVGVMILAMGAIGVILYTSMQWGLSAPSFPLGVSPEGFSHPHVKPQETWMPHISMNGLLPLIALPVLIALGVWGFLSWRKSRINPRQGAKTGTSGWVIGMMVLIGLSVAVFALSGRGRFYPTSSLSPDFHGPVIGRVKFIFTHPDAVSGGSTALFFDVKQGGDTQWFPRSETWTTLQAGSVTYKCRVDASRGGAPRAMVTTSRNAIEWEMGEETKEMPLEMNSPGGTLVFDNGLRVTVQWNPVGN